MNKMKLVLIAGLIMLVSPAYPQVKDMDVMVKKIFSVLQHEDEAGFIKLFPDAATTREFVMKIFSKEIAEGKGKEEEVDELFGQLTDSVLQAKYRETFTEIIQKGESKGINWAKAEFDNYMADSSFEEETKMGVMQGKIYFSSSKEKYFLSFSEVIWFENRGWYGVSINRIDELSKETEPEEFDWGTVDSVTVVMDTAVAILDTAVTIPAERPATKEKTNTKQPGKNKPLKNKSQTSAKKPE